MPETFSEWLPWLLTGSGMIFWATWLLGFLNKLRRPENDDYLEYPPYMQVLSDKVGNLTSIQMQNLSVVAFFVPLIIVYVVVNIVPVEWLLFVEPHIGALVAALLVYVAQQRAYYRWYR